jgi:hypothetical protein
VPVKRYAKIGHSDDGYFVHRKSVINNEMVIMKSEIETRDEAEGFLDDFDPLFDDCDQDERFVVRI